MTKQIYSLIKLLVLIVGISFGLNSAYAWTAPTVLPPAGNVAAPINTSGTMQSKAATMRVDLAGSGDSFVGTGSESNIIVRHDTGTRFTKFMNSASPSSASSGFQFTDGTVSNTPVVTIQNAGNVGVGTVTPTQKLDVAGNIRATDVCTTTGTCLNTAGGGVPAGAVMYFNLSSCPAGWIPANGTAGTPDLRGEFIRGLDSGRGVDAGRGLATWQGERVGIHSHNYLIREGGNNPWWQYANAATVSAYNWRTTVDNGTTGPENRPRNVALLACVKS